MSEDKELEQIRLKKIQDMLDQAEATKTPNTQPINITDDNFQSTVKTNDLLVIDFWAPWCGPCKIVGPIIDQLATEYAGKVTFAKMNVDKNQIIPSNFGIMSIPTILVIHKGKVVEGIVGAYPKTHIEAAIKRHLDKPIG